MAQRRRTSSSINWALWLCTLSAMFFGACGGLLFTTHKDSAVISTQRASIASLSGRVALLTDALKSQAESHIKLEQQPEATSETTELAPDLPAEAPPDKSTANKAVRPVTPTPPEIASTKKSSTKPLPEVLSPSKTVAAKPAEVAERPPEKPPEAQQESPISVAAAATVPPSSVHAAPPVGRIEGVTLEQAGISKLWADAVDFKSGRRIRVGEKFPSGERLTGIDASSGRIITDQRQILLLDK